MNNFQTLARSGWRSRSQLSELLKFLTKQINNGFLSFQTSFNLELALSVSRNSSCRSLALALLNVSGLFALYGSWTRSLLNRPTFSGQWRHLVAGHGALDSVTKDIKLMNSGHVSFLAHESTLGFIKLELSASV